MQEAPAPTVDNAVPRDPKQDGKRREVNTLQLFLLFSVNLQSPEYMFYMSFV